MVSTTVVAVAVSLLLTSPVTEARQVSPRAQPTQTTGVVDVPVSHATTVAEASVRVSDRAGEASRSPGADASGLTLERALVLAARSAPRRRVAKAEVDAVHERAEAASIWQGNPQLTVSGGPRWQAQDVAPQWSIGVRQPLDLARKQRARLGHADAAVAEAIGDDALRLLRRDVSTSFVIALYWRHRGRLAADQVALAETIMAATTTRRDLGDASGFDVSRAALLRARATAERARCRGSEIGSLVELGMLVGLDADDDVVLAGDLGGLARRGLMFDRAVSSGASVAAQSSRSTLRHDVRVAAARVQAAAAAFDMAKTRSLPGLAVGVGFGREADESIVLGTVALTLPAFDRGQGDRAIAVASQRTANVDLANKQLRVAGEITRARAVVAELVAALSEFEAVGLTQLERIEQQAITSFEAGALPLAELLQLRREWFAARQDYAELLLAAAMAQVDLHTAADLWPENHTAEPAISGSADQK